jgi:hypothetical protein
MTTHRLPIFEVRPGPAEFPLAALATTQDIFGSKFDTPLISLIEDQSLADIGREITPC